MEPSSLFKTETREAPANTFNVLVCTIEGCGEEFSDEEDAKEHYLRNHLSIEKKKIDVGTFLLFSDEGTFKLFTEFPYKNSHPWCDGTEWEGPGWYCLEYGDRLCGCSCKCSEDYALLTKATTWLWSKAFDLERGIKRKQKKLQRYNELLEEMGKEEIQEIEKMGEIPSGI